MSTSKVETMLNQAWLVANDKEIVYEGWLVEHDLCDCEESLQLFINEFRKVVGQEKMRQSFSFCNGFFICWEDQKCGTCKIFNRSRHEIDFLYSVLASKMDVKKYQFKNGVLKQIA